MKNLISKFGVAIALAATLLVLAIGCGGGGATGGSTGVPLTLFVTDNYRDGYDGVYGTIYKMEFLQADSTAATVYESTEGKTFNFRKLWSGSSRYAFLSKADIPAGTYTAVRLTIAPTMQVFATGNTTGTTYPVEGTTNGAGKIVITADFSVDKVINSPDDLAIDFDLASFTLSGGKLVPVIRDDNSNNVDDSSRHEEDDVHGTVSDLTSSAGAYTFTLSMPRGQTMAVRTNAGTAIFNSNGSANPSLSNGDRVEIRGTYNTAGAYYDAVSVKIETGDGSSEDPHQAKGSPSSINAETGSFQITTDETEGFFPNANPFSVQTNSGTIYRSGSGVTMLKADWFAGLSSVKFVEVEGTYNSTSGVFTATKVKYENENHGGDDPGSEAEARGTAGSLNSGARTFSISLIEWEGFSPTGNSVTVQLAGKLEIKNSANENISESTFFSTANAKSVKVEGKFDGTKIIASEIKILN